MTNQEILKLIYKEVEPKTFKEFWKSLYKYKDTYPSLKDTTLKQVEEVFLQSREY